MTTAYMYVQDLFILGQVQNGVYRPAEESVPLADAITLDDSLSDASSEFHFDKTCFDDNEWAGINSDEEGTGMIDNEEEWAGINDDQGPNVGNHHLGGGNVNATNVSLH